MHMRSRSILVAVVGSFALLACAKATYSGNPHRTKTDGNERDASAASDQERDETAPAVGDDTSVGTTGEGPSAESGDTDDSSDPDIDATNEASETTTDEGTGDESDADEASTSDDSSTNATNPTPGDAGAEPGPELSDRVVIPARIEAEDFVRYNEQDIDNDSGDCGPGPVDLGTTNDDDGGCYVGWTQGGEWLEYDVWAESSAEYTLSLRMASDAVSDVEVLVDDRALYSAPAPGAGWESFQSVNAGTAELTQGAHVVRVRFVAGQVNLNHLVFTRGGPIDNGVPSLEGDAGQSSSEPPEPAPGTQGCAAPPDGYSLVWSDTFDYEGLPDPERWGYETGGDGFGNNELQFYTEAQSDNAHVEAGVLTIAAIYEPYMGNDYTSAKLNSGFGASNPGTWNEGVFSIRAKLPRGLGTWPALWMMPTDCVEGWPACGEIDIMESVGYDEGVVHGTIHTDAFNHVEGTQIGLSTEVPDATSAFHTYTTVWTSERIEWQVDGAIYHSVDREADWGFAEWPFDDKLWHLMINLAVGGDWGGAEGVESADYPASFEVDSVCVYQ